MCTVSLNLTPTGARETVIVFPGHGGRVETEAERGKWLVEGLIAEPDPEPLPART